MTNQTTAGIQFCKVLVTVWCAALAPAVAAGQVPEQKPAKPWISVASQPPFIMSAEQANAVAPLLTTLEPDVAAKDVSLTLLEVRYEKIVDESLIKGFTVSGSIDRGAGRGPAILITVAHVSDLRPGEYQLSLNAKAVRASNKPPYEDVALAIKLERPGVELEQPGKVTIDVLYPFPFLGGSTAVFPPMVRLVPTAASKFSRLATIEPYVGALKTSAGKPGGTLELKPLTPVDAGRPLLVAVTPHDIPAGVSTGTIEFRGPDLQAPRSVEVELRARRSSGWVVVFIALGLVFGYVLRVYLQHRVELARARTQSTTVLDDLQQEIDRTPDQKFAAALKKAGIDLRKAAGSDDRAAIEAQAASARTVLTSARIDLQQRIQQTHDRLQTFASIGADPANLPPEMADIVRVAADTRARGAALLDSLNETEASSGLDAAGPALTGRATTAFARWRTLMPARLQEMDDLKFLLPKPAVDELSTALTDLRSKVAGVAAPQGLDTIGAVLSTVRQVQAFTAARAVWLSDVVKSATGALEKLFIDRSGGAPIADAQRSARDIVSMLAAVTSLMDPSKPIYEPATHEALISEYEKLSDVVHQRYQKANVPELAAFDAARAQRRYGDALEALPAGATKLKKEPGGTDERPSFQEPHLEEKPAPPTGDAPVVRQEPIAVLKARTFGELARLESVQTLLVGVLTASLGYVLFAEDFVGTTKDLASVFMWGFTLDISLSKLIEIATPLTTKAKA